MDESQFKRMQVTGAELVAAGASCVLPMHSKTWTCMNGSVMTPAHAWPPAQIQAAPADHRSQIIEAWWHCSRTSGSGYQQQQASSGSSWRPLSFCGSLRL
jgi:hypothetical protein